MPRSASALGLIAPPGLVFFFSDGRCAQTNGAPADDAWLQERAREVLRTGAPLVGVAHEGLRASFYPVRDGAETVGVGVTLEDDSERSRAQAGLQLLADAG